MKVIRGFTFIELLLVAAVISLLSSIGLASLNKARVKSRNIKTTHGVTQMITALFLYYDTYGKFPCHTFESSMNNGVENPNFIRPLFDSGLISRDVLKNNVYHFEYASFSDSGPGCGQYAYLGFYSEGNEIVCPYGLGHAHVFNGLLHCHEILPQPMYMCADPYWVTAHCPNYPPDTINEY
jgi:prepilin-type N-terminal cleavage/methylation domain-containing protein